MPVRRHVALWRLSTREEKQLVARRYAITNYSGSCLQTESQQTFPLEKVMCPTEKCAHAQCVLFDGSPCVRPSLHTLLSAPKAFLHVTQRVIYMGPDSIRRVVEVYDEVLSEYIGKAALVCLATDGKVELAQIVLPRIPQ